MIDFTGNQIDPEDDPQATAGDDELGLRLGMHLRRRLARPLDIQRIAHAHHIEDEGWREPVLPDVVVEKRGPVAVVVPAWRLGGR